MNIQNNIKLLREQNGFTQQDLAEKVKVSRQTIIPWRAAGTTIDISGVSHCPGF